MSIATKKQHIFSPSGDKTRFADEVEHFATNFMKMRKLVAIKLKNPRLKLISLRTFRHWKATMEYAKIKDILHVMQMLGHKNVENTLRYIHLANAISDISDESVCKVAKTIKEASELIEVGFEYVTEMDSAKLFRKRK